MIDQDRTERTTSLGRTTTRTDAELTAARVCLRALFVGDCPVSHRWTLIGTDDLPVMLDSDPMAGWTPWKPRD